MRALKALMWVGEGVVSFVLPLAVLLSLAFGWAIIRGLALSGAIVLTAHFVAFLLRRDALAEDDSDDDGDGGEPDEDEVPPPETRLLLEVKQPERDEWRN